MRTAESLRAVIDEFDKVVGCDRLGALHVNDSMTELGSNRDRHINLGDGEIGVEGMIAFLSEPRFEGLPVIFEGPGRSGKGIEAAGHGLGLRPALARARRATQVTHRSFPGMGATLATCTTTTTAGWTSTCPA